MKGNTVVLSSMPPALPKLAITPDGSKLYGFMQSPLIQDGALDKDNKRIGRNIRILEVTP